MEIRPPARRIRPTHPDAQRRIIDNAKRASERVRASRGEAKGSEAKGSDESKADKAKK